MNIKDSGSRTEFESGAKRDCQGGKGRMDLMPWRAIMELSKVYEAGCEKYGDRNWEKGIPCSRYADSGPRHFGKWMIGMDDEEHLKMACWNFMSLLDTILRIKDGILPESLNDLPCCPEFKGPADCRRRPEACTAGQIAEALGISPRAIPPTGVPKGAFDDS